MRNRKTYTVGSYYNEAVRNNLLYVVIRRYIEAKGKDLFMKMTSL